MISANNRHVSESDLICAVDLGGTNLRGATVDRNGTIHYRLKQMTPLADTPDAIVRALVSAARNAKARQMRKSEKYLPLL